VVRECSREHESLGRLDSAMLDTGIRPVNLAIALWAGGVVRYLLLAITIRNFHVDEADETVEIFGVVSRKEDRILALDFHLSHSGPRCLAATDATPLDLSQIRQRRKLAVLGPPGLLLGDVVVGAVFDKITLCGEGTGTGTPLSNTNRLHADGWVVGEIRVIHLGQLSPEGDVDGGSRAVGERDQAL